ncbi:MAG TPA: hypothetical protein VJ755_09745 [Gemmatimonadales bacterium]|nr:hypothetical protein [Gemmatimonadales bacterium]
MRLLLTLFTAAALVVSIVACSDSFSPTVENVAGDYSLARLTTVTDTGGTDEWVPAGAVITISLDTNGTTTGHLFIPHGGEQGADLDADMAGTWTLTNGIVEFDQPNADTFVRDWAFTAVKNRLSAEHSVPGLRVIVALAK